MEWKYDKKHSSIVFYDGPHTWLEFDMSREHWAAAFRLDRFALNPFILMFSGAFDGIDKRELEKESAVFSSQVKGAVSNVHAYALKLWANLTAKR